MFRLHDSTRRLICTATFLGFCVLPTLAIGGLAAIRRLPWGRQAEQQRLAGELGVAVSIESMAHTLPGVIRYKGLKLTDPETGLELLRCGELEATWTSFTDTQGKRPAVVLEARQVESPATALERLQELLRRRMECQSGRPEFEVRVTADQWTIFGNSQPHLLRQVEGGIGLMSSGIEARLFFHVAGANSKSPVRMRMVRNRQVVPPANGFDLDTGPNAVPCRLLAAHCAELAALGPNCCFSGYLSIFQSSGGWSGEISGQLHAVDLQCAAQAGFIPMTSGIADVTLQKVRFQQGRIEELSGCNVIAPGGQLLATLAVSPGARQNGWLAQLQPVPQGESVRK